MAPTDPVAAGQEECNYCKKTINNNLQCESSYHPSCVPKGKRRNKMLQKNIVQTQELKNPS